MTEIVKASLENGVQKSVSRQTKATIQPTFQLQKEFLLRSPFTVCTLLQTVIRKFCLKKKASWNQSAWMRREDNSFYPSRIRST